MDEHNEKVQSQTHLEISCWVNAVWGQVQGRITYRIAVLYLGLVPGYGVYILKDVVVIVRSLQEVCSHIQQGSTVEKILLALLNDEYGKVSSLSLQKEIEVSAGTSVSGNPS